MKTLMIQAPLIWENALKNMRYFEEKINQVSEKIDLIVLPEMFTTGFTINPQNVAQTMEGETIHWLKATAAAKSCAITGSLVILEEGRYYNRLVFVHPNGDLDRYDKRHLFTLSGEGETYTAGRQRLVVEYNGWKICPLICYDLRFPVFSRNTEDYDLLVYVANWPKTRVTAWDALLKARAIENMSYVVGVNRVGDDENGLEYVGHSQIIDHLGNELVAPSENDGLFIGTLDKNAMMEDRKKLPFLNDRDQFTVV